MAMLTYGCGFRLLECLRLRVKDADFQYRQILVRDAKGQKDRVTVLPGTLLDPLRTHLVRIRALHEADLRDGFGRAICHTPWPRSTRGREDDHDLYPRAQSRRAWSRQSGGSRLIRLVTSSYPHQVAALQLPRLQRAVDLYVLESRWDSGAHQCVRPIAHLEMQMRLRRAARATNRSNLLPATHLPPASRARCPASGARIASTPHRAGMMM